MVIVIFVVFVGNGPHDPDVLLIFQSWKQNRACRFCWTSVFTRTGKLLADIKSKARVPVSRKETNSPKGL